MATFDNNQTIYFKNGWAMRKDGALIPAGIIDQPGLPSAEWLSAVRSYLMGRKDALAIASVDFEPGPINQEPRVTLVINFDTGRTERHDSYALFMETFGAIRPNSMGISSYDWGAAMQIIEARVTIEKG